MSSDRWDVDLSVADRLWELRDHARNNGYSVARHYLGEAESGRITVRPRFVKVIDDGGKTRRSLP